MCDSELLINPPQEVFDQIVYWTGETEQWAFQLNDYSFRDKSYDKFWLFTIVEKGTMKLITSLSLALWECEDGNGPLYSIGMFYCKKEHRGYGHARRLFAEIMPIIGDDNATLNSVPSMSEKYAQVFGFDKIASYWLLSSSILMNNFAIPSDMSTEKFTVKNWNEIDLSAIHEYDRTICRRNRRRIMTNWFNIRDTCTRVILNDYGKIVGYCTIRQVSNNRLSVAPLYADSLESAEVLLAATVQGIPKFEEFTKIMFLHPDSNLDAPRLCERFAKNGQVATVKFAKSQFTKKFIESSRERVYSISDCPHQFV